MNRTTFVSTNEIRLQFTRALSEMYQLEVPQYKALKTLAKNVNKKFLNDLSDSKECQTELLSIEHHGAIRVGTAQELSQIKRLFSVMGMQPVDYYDLSVAGIPVHSTAFRALDNDDLATSPFRVFCSLLRLDFIDSDNGLRQQAEEILNNRTIFPNELLKLIDLAEKQGGLNLNQTKMFIENALKVFRWRKSANVDKQTYDQLKNAHGLITDIVSFKGAHINHLTPKVLDIDECQNQFIKNNIKAKAVVEGPPKRKCPILLRQTSFLALAENITFSDGEDGSHTARFGEVEQRGIALTPKGRDLYDQLLTKARNAKNDNDYSSRLEDAFKNFPDDYEEIRQQGLGYFHYSVNNEKRHLKDQKDNIEILIKKGIVKVTPINYEDFLPVSAAGIFTSNLTNHSKLEASNSSNQTQNNSLGSFEKALGSSVMNSFKLYEKQQQKSLDKTLETLGVNEYE